ncbi:hypothetical protein ACPV5U_08740 [Vibrio mediterranei]
MNPRIFKKLTQRAAKALKAKNHVQYLEEVVQTEEDSGPEIKCGFKWELKSYYRKARELKYWSAWNVRTLNGTTGFGATSGYYEPEWDDNDALSMVMDAVFESFTDWENYDGDINKWPENHRPKKLRKPAKALKYFIENFKVEPKR